MEQIREFACMLCIASVGCCLLKMLLPESSLEPVLKVVLSAFFLLCLLLPLRRLPFLPDDIHTVLEERTAPDTRSLAETYQRQLEKAVADNMEQVVKIRIEKMGITGTNIQIKVNTDGEGRIDITGVEISLDGEYAARKYEIEDYLTRELELPCEIILTGEEKADGD